MNRVLFGVISVVVAVCFFGLVPSAAKVVTGIPQMEGDHIALPNVVAEMDEKDDDSRGFKAKTSVIGFLQNNYIKEVYTSTAAPSGESYNSRAVRGFISGEDVYLVVRFWKVFTGSYTTYFIVSDQTGAMKLFYGVVGPSTTTGDKINQLRIIGLPAGCYYLNVVILADGNSMISPPGYTFIVE